MLGEIVPCTYTLNFGLFGGFMGSSAYFEAVSFRHLIPLVSSLSLSLSLSLSAEKVTVSEFVDAVKSGKWIIFLVVA